MDIVYETLVRKKIQFQGANITRGILIKKGQH
jgi:hypothetical protein